MPTRHTKLVKSFKIWIYHGVYYHPDRDELQFSCRITNPNTGFAIEEFFATEREANPLSKFIQ